MKVSFTGKIVHFVQYNNFFILMVVAVVMGGGAAFAASPDLRQGVLAENVVAKSVDNSYVVNTNFDTYDVGLKILNVTEDDTWYYIDYSYKTAEVQDYTWKEATKSASIKVSKGELGGRDLGLYVANQLGQVTDQQITYLKQIQTKEKKNGLTQKVLATEYTGLVGHFLSTDEKTFEGYQPVKVDTTGNNDTQQGSVSTVPSSTGEVKEQPLNKDQIQALIADAIKQILTQKSQDTTVATTSITTSQASTVVTPDTPQQHNGQTDTPSTNPATDTSDGTSSTLQSPSTASTTDTTVPVTDPASNTTPSPTTTTDATQSPTTDADSASSQVTPSGDTSGADASSTQ